MHHHSIWPRRSPWFLLLALGCAITRAAGPDDALTFIHSREPTWFEHQHPDLQEAFPFGRSDLANDKKLAAKGSFGALTSFEALDHKHFISEGDKYAVEWFYHATWLKTKNRQVEASLCFAQIKDQMIIRWTEYFDDTVGELQDQHLLPLYGETEEPTPWPAGPGVTRIYRP